MRVSTNIRITYAFAYNTKNSNCRCWENGTCDKRRKIRLLTYSLTVEAIPLELMLNKNEHSRNRDRNPLGDRRDLIALERKRMKTEKYRKRWEKAVDSLNSSRPVRWVPFPIGNCLSIRSETLYEVAGPVLFPEIAWESTEIPVLPLWVISAGASTLVVNWTWEQMRPLFEKKEKNWKVPEFEQLAEEICIRQLILCHELRWCQR